MLSHGLEGGKTHNKTSRRKKDETPENINEGPCRTERGPGGGIGGRGSGKGERGGHQYSKIRQLATNNRGGAGMPKKNRLGKRGTEECGGGGFRRGFY